MDKNINLIDDYLTGNLNQEQTLNFENNLTSDANLQSEVNFQKDVINSIKENRKNELKTRLNSINVASSTSSVWQKVAIAASTVIISGGIAMFVTTNDEANEVTKAPIAEQNSTIEILEDVTVTLPISIDELIILEERESEEVSAPQGTQKSSPAPKQETVVNVDPLFNTPSPNTTDNDIDIDHKLDIDKGINTTDVKIKEDGLKVYPENKKNRFHYKYDGKTVLVQIAEYSEQSPAVLIDFPEKKEVFLNYNGVFYQLDKSKTWDTLSKHVITNTNLIKTLKEKIK
jgi:hypothetical protein